MLLALALAARSAPLAGSAPLLSCAPAAARSLSHTPPSPRSALAHAAFVRRHPSPSMSEVVSPFQENTSTKKATVGPLELTRENVELVLDEMRPYLMADGGNVAVRSIEGKTVQLELQGACGSCPSSTVTMKMGLERGLKEKIPSIEQVVQVAQAGRPLTKEGVEGVLEEIRPFLKMAGGTVDLISLDTEGLQPTANLSISGASATINSVRVEIAQRLKRNFPALTTVSFDA